MKASRELLIDLTSNKPRITSALTQQSYLMQAKRLEGRKIQRLENTEKKINYLGTWRRLEEFKTNSKEAANQEIHVGQTKLELLIKA